MTAHCEKNRYKEDFTAVRLKPITVKQGRSRVPKKSTKMSQRLEMPTRNFHIIDYLYKTLGILVMYTIICYSKNYIFIAGKQGEV